MLLWSDDMTTLLAIYKVILKIVYFFFKMFKTKKNRIIFLSRQDNKPSIDFIYLIDDINKRYPEYEIKVLTRRLEKNNPKQIIRSLFDPFIQSFYLATSSICIIDGYQIPVSCLHHKSDLKIIQIWHSLGAIKMFGYQTLNTKYDQKMAKLMCMHKNYDAIISPSSEMSKYFAKAFNNPIEKFVNIGLPRIDYLLKTAKQNRNTVYKRYPKLKNKKVILYAPTFRVYDEYKIDELIEEFKNSTKWELIVKIHPRMKVHVPKKYTYDKVSSLEALSVADYVITDYSAISLEASILNKPVVLYTYDEEKYREYEGINTDLDNDWPGYNFKDAKSIAKFIKSNKYDKKILKDYCDKYIRYKDGSVTRRLTDYIIGGKYEKN